jgi:hypothetical protein
VGAASNFTRDTVAYVDGLAALVFDFLWHDGYGDGEIWDWGCVVVSISKMAVMFLVVWKFRGAGGWLSPKYIRGEYSYLRGCCGTGGVPSWIRLMSYPQHREAAIQGALSPKGFSSSILHDLCVSILLLDIGGA